MVYEGHVYAGVERTSNYFGKSNFASDALFDGCLDDIKIFNRGLSQAEIEIEKNSVRPLQRVVEPTILADGIYVKFNIYSFQNTFFQSIFI